MTLAMIATHVTDRVYVVLELSPGGGVTVDAPLKGVFKTKKLALTCARTFAGDEAVAFKDHDNFFCLLAQPDLIIQVRTAYIIG